MKQASPVIDHSHILCYEPGSVLKSRQKLVQTWSQYFSWAFRLYLLSTWTKSTPNSASDLAQIAVCDVTANCENNLLLLFRGNRSHSLIDVIINNIQYTIKLHTLLHIKNTQNESFKRIHGQSSVLKKSNSVCATCTTIALIQSTSLLISR